MIPGVSSSPRPGSDLGIIAARCLWRRLRQLSDKFQDCWTAEWPYRAWLSLHHRQTRRGVRFTDAQVQELAWLSGQAGGWVEEDGSFVAMEEWHRRFQNWEERRHR
jgi:hypothetical protein